MRKNAAMHHIVVLALPDVVAFDLAIPLQVFGHVDRRHHYRVDVAAEQHETPTTTGYAVTRTADLSVLAAADTVVVPGFWPFLPSDAALDALRAAHARGARMVSICTGAFALAQAGVLDGLRATTHWHHTAELAEFESVTVDPDVLYVDQGQVLTSAGVAAGLDLSLHLLRLDHGADAAAEVARRMVVAPHRDGGQAQYLDRPLPTSARSSAVANCSKGEGSLAGHSRGRSVSAFSAISSRLSTVRLRARSITRLRAIVNSQVSKRALPLYCAPRSSTRIQVS